jgi:hypothetical protein
VFRFLFRPETPSLHAPKDGAGVELVFFDFHISNLSCLSIPTSFSSAANAASVLSRNCFIASSTVSTSCSKSQGEATFPEVYQGALGRKENLFRKRDGPH